VDSALHADSFGLGPTDSVGNEAAAQVLRNNSSVGNFSASFLAQTGSGALTIGYSPVNSFGNASPPATRGSSIMTVGGLDARSTSPTQVLGMYPSYSGGGGHGASRPLDDSHLRMSVGSFGGHSMAGYNRSYSENPSAPPTYYMGGPHPSHDDRMPPFYVALRTLKDAFNDCIFLLPGLKAAIVEDSAHGETEGESVAKSDEAAQQRPDWERSVSTCLVCQHCLRLLVLNHIQIITNSRCTV
jgi:hypothetical protein